MNRAASNNRYIHSEICSRADTHNQLALLSHTHPLASLLELSRTGHRAAGEPSKSAGVVEEIARMVGGASSIKVGRRRCGAQCLDSRSYGSCDHTLMSG